MNVDTLPLLAINNLLMFWLAEGGCITCDWKNNIIIKNRARMFMTFLRRQNYTGVRYKFDS
jgi:hypothetical protein